LEAADAVRAMCQGCVCIGARVSRSRRSLRVPFVFKPLTRPPAPGPFPALPQRESTARPQTVFSATIAPRRSPGVRAPPPIAVRLFLPHAQVQPAAERIAFRLALRAPAALLAPFAASPPPSPLSPSFASFLPISPVRSSDSDGTSSTGSLRRALRRGARRGAAVNVRLERRTCVGARTAATDVLAVAVLHRTEDADWDSEGDAKGDASVRWWGALDVPAGACCAGFVAERVSVQVRVCVCVRGVGVCADLADKYACRTLWWSRWTWPGRAHIHTSCRLGSRCQSG
jgi:hypothetical protein